MSSSDLVQELLNYKKDIEKDFKVIYIIINILNKQDEEKIINILKRMYELKVTSKDIKVNTYIILFYAYQTSKIVNTLKLLKKSKNQSLNKEYNKLMSQWKKVVRPDESDEKKNPNSKPKTPSKKEKDDFPEKYFIDGDSRRNNTMKNLYKNLKIHLNNESEKDKEDLVQKVVKIEKAIYEKYKGDSPYTNRVLEILHNIKDKSNEEFREKIIKGEIDPEVLATMDEIEMLDTKKRTEINKTIENKVNESRSDWNEKHTKATSGVYKCRKCGGNKTTQSEMQTRSADEPMTLFIHCVDCGNDWKIQIYMINSIMHLKQI